MESGAIGSPSNGRVATAPQSPPKGSVVHSLKAASNPPLDFIEKAHSFKSSSNAETFRPPASNGDTFSKRVEKARSQEEVMAAYKDCPPTAEELRETTNKRWSRLKDRMGYATRGIKRWTAIGGVCMTVVSITLTLCGAPLGAGISFVLGLAVCMACVATGLFTYVRHRHELLQSAEGKRWHAEQLEVIRGLEQVAEDMGLGPHDAECRKIIRCKHVLEGKLWFVVVEIIKGTAIEPLYTLTCDAGRRLALAIAKRKAKKARN